MFSDILSDVIRELGDNHKRAIDEVASACKNYLLSIVKYCIENKDVRDKLIPIPKLEPYLRKYGKIIRKRSDAYKNLFAINGIDITNGDFRVKLSSGNVVVGSNIEEAFANLASMKVNTDIALRNANTEIKRLNAILAGDLHGDSLLQ